MADRDYKIDLGKRIKEFRNKKDITQEAFAEKIDLGTPQQISDIEHGKKGISIPKLMDICEVLGVEADYLLFGVNKSNIDTQFAKYLNHMTDEQLKYALELIKVYAKSCGIDEI